MLKADNFPYNFKFLHYIEELQTLKFVSAGFNSVEDFIKTVKPFEESIICLNTFLKENHVKLILIMK